MAAASSSQAAPGLPYLSRPKVIIAQEAPSPNVIIPAIPEGPSKNVLQATQDVCDHLARMAGRVSDLFDMFDVDKNGLIDKKEFRAACLHVGITYPPDVIDQVFALLDEDGSGSLEHMEVIRTARRAAFERGFVPRVPPKPPAHQRRLNAYWARRNRMHMEAHEESVRKIEAQVSLPCMHSCTHAFVGRLHPRGSSSSSLSAPHSHPCARPCTLIRMRRCVSNGSTTSGMRIGRCWRPSTSGSGRWA